jgi:pyridoxamine 5'-phosphate oxidase
MMGSPALDAVLPYPLPADPMPLLGEWYDAALAARQQPNPDAMTLATCTPGGRPSARIVLCKEIDVECACVVFFTNYRSRKGDELEANPRACAVFHWDHASRQARVEGRVERTSEAESDVYFAGRPLLSRIGAWASEQSRPLRSRDELTERVGEVMARFGVGVAHLLGEGEPLTIPRPPCWGGYRLWIERVELWAGGEGRLHDRAAWQVDSPDVPSTVRPPRRPSGHVTAWTSMRLQP